MVFQTGQIWAFCRHNDVTPRYYCRIQKITLTQTLGQATELKLHVHRLKATRFPENVIKWEDKKMPVGCGTFSVGKGFLIFSPLQLVHQIMPQTSMDGNEYTILPKIGQVWVIYRMWAPHFDVEALEEHYLDFDVVEVLNDALNYTVLALKRAVYPSEEKKIFFRAAKSRPSYCYDEDGSGVIFTIPKEKLLRFSHQLPASQVTKEIEGELKVLFEVDSSVLPICIDRR